MITWEVEYADGQSVDKYSKIYVPTFVCDCCKEVVDGLYEYNDEQYCQDCLLECFDYIDDGNADYDDDYEDDEEDDYYYD